MRKITPITVGVLGLGRAGWDIHVRALRDDPRFRIVAVADAVEERRAQAQTELGCAVHRTPAALLAACDAELIINATPSPLHAPISCDALRAGFHVVVEKPIARDLKEARGMVRAAAASRRKLFAHHNYRFQPAIRHLRDTIASGILGRVFEIRVCISSFSRRNDWQTLRKNHGGLLNNHGTHYIDSVMQMLGAPVTDVWSDLKLVSDSGDCEDHVRVLLRARNGAVADIFLSTSSAIPLPMWTVWGTSGTLVCDQGETVIRHFDPRRVPPLPVRTGPAVGRRYGNDDKLPWQETRLRVPEDVRPTFYDNVFEVLRQRQPMAVTPDSVLDFFAVMERARRPVQTWRPAYGSKRT
ncbi:MAG: Gfo/Idh/MocA family oxidoreductase [Lentisphaerae bacterium]|nr:Gfo/Idh/MocA family oxidoreductase [Lentisphaerota bacterium]